jgi:hypothetical protein
MPPRDSNDATASTATEIGSSTPRCTSSPWFKAAGTHAPARTSSAGRPKARPDSKRALPQATVGPRRVPPPAPDPHEASRARRQGPRRQGPSACPCLRCRWSLRPARPTAPDRVRHSTGRAQGPPRHQGGRRSLVSITPSRSPLPAARSSDQPVSGRPAMRMSADAQKQKRDHQATPLSLLVEAVA